MQPSSKQHILKPQTPTETYPASVQWVSGDGVIANVVNWVKKNAWNVTRMIVIEQLNTKMFSVTTH